MADRLDRSGSSPYWARRWRGSAHCRSGWSRHAAPKVSGIRLGHLLAAVRLEVNCPRRRFDCRGRWRGSYCRHSYGIRLRLRTTHWRERSRESAVRRVVGSRVGDSDKGLGIAVGTAIPHIGQVGSVCLSGALHSGRLEQERWLRQHGGVVETSRATRLKSNAKCRSTECDEVILSNQPQPARLKVRSANMGNSNEGAFPNISNPSHPLLVRFFVWPRCSSPTNLTPICWSEPDRRALLAQWLRQAARRYRRVQPP